MLAQDILNNHFNPQIQFIERAKNIVLALIDFFEQMERIGSVRHVEHAIERLRPTAQAEFMLGDG